MNWGEIPSREEGKESEWIIQTETASDKPFLLTPNSPIILPWGLCLLKLFHCLRVGLFFSSLSPTNFWKMKGGFPHVGICQKDSWYFNQLPFHCFESKDIGESDKKNLWLTVFSCCLRLASIGSEAHPDSSEFSFGNLGQCVTYHWEVKLSPWLVVGPHTS